MIKPLLLITSVLAALATAKAVDTDGGRRSTEQTYASLAANQYPIANFETSDDNFVIGTLPIPCHLPDSMPLIPHQFLVMHCNCHGDFSTKHEAANKDTTNKNIRIESSEACEVNYIITEAVYEWWEEDGMRDFYWNVDGETAHWGFSGWKIELGNGRVAQSLFAFFVMLRILIALD